MADQKLSLPCAPTKTETAARAGSVKRAAIYTRVSTGDQHPETQLCDLRELAKQRRYEIVREYPNFRIADKPGVIPRPSSVNWAQGKCSRSDTLAPQPPFVDSRMPRP